MQGAAPLPEAAGQPTPPFTPGAPKQEEQDQTGKREKPAEAEGIIDDMPTAAKAAAHSELPAETELAKSLGDTASSAAPNPVGVRGGLSAAEEAELRRRQELTEAGVLESSSDSEGHDAEQDAQLHGLARLGAGPGRRACAELHSVAIYGRN